jgi:uncharacterized protein
VSVPAGQLDGRQAIRGRFSHLFANVVGERAGGKYRLCGENFAVDDKIWTARVVGEFLGIPGNARGISIRALHVPEFRDGLICRENVWLEAGAAVAQLRNLTRSRNSYAASHRALNVTGSMLQ